MPTTDKQPPRMQGRRRIVARDILATAHALFLRNGYEATTMDDIAAAVGISQRTMFRYFPAKSDIMLSKLDLIGEEMLEMLAQRPLAEPAWISLRHALEAIVRHMVEAGDHNAQQIEIVFHTPALMAGYLQRLQHNQDLVTAALLERAEARGMPHSNSDPTPHALTAAAFGCAVAAQRCWLANDCPSPLGGFIDRAMTAIAPITPAAPQA